jgi:hypothetical protein
VASRSQRQPWLQISGTGLTRGVPGGGPRELQVRPWRRSDLNRSAVAAAITAHLVLIQPGTTDEDTIRLGQALAGIAKVRAA